MRVLNLSLDKNIVEKDSAVQRRLIALAEEIAEKVKHHPLASQTRHSPSTEGERKRKEFREGLTVLVPGEKDEVHYVSPHLTVYSFGGLKLLQLWKMWRVGKKILSGDSSFHKGGGESARRRILNPSSNSEVGVLPSRATLEASARRVEKGELRPCDLITVQDVYFVALIGYLLSRRFHVPLEVQVHGLEKFEGFRKQLAQYVLRKASRIRVVSERLLQLLTTNYRLPTTKMYKLPVYTQIEAPQRTVKRKTVPYPFTFLTVGRLVPVKNITLQIKAFAKVAEKVPHIRLRIVGDGPLRESLQSEVKSLKLEDKIIFEGYQKDTGRFYREADAFLLTSDYEGWGLVVLEAAAHRLPIIMTDVGLAREVIKNEESGFIIPAGDEHELVLSMKEFLDKPELRQRLGEAAFQIFKKLPSQQEQLQKQLVEWRALASRK